MNGAMRQALWTLEWKRLQSGFILLLAGFVLLNLIAVLVFDTFDALTLFLVVWPVLSGLLLSAGLVSDDAQSGILPLMLSLPVSRASLWLHRVLFRFGLFLVIITAWYLTSVIGGFQVGSWDRGSTIVPTHVLLIMAGCLMFAAGLVGTTIMRNSFEAAIASGITGLLAIAVLRTLQNDVSHLAGCAVMIAGLVLAGRDLFLCREPLDCLRVRLLMWMAGLWGMLVLVDWVM